jgi:hypothetical protein
MNIGAFELRFLHAAIEELQTYLLSDKLFLPIGILPKAGQPSYPQLTLGNITLFRRRFQAYIAGNLLARSQENEFQHLIIEIDALHNKWRTAWENKATHEFQSRFRQWVLYLNEVDADPSRHGIYYSSDVKRRVILELLLDQLPSFPPEEERMLPEVDSRLRLLFIPGEFIWNAELKLGFPKEIFWFLYGDIDIDRAHPEL